jgi:hypothetical protein
LNVLLGTGLPIPSADGLTLTNATLLTRNATQRRRRGSPPRWIGGRRLQDVHVVPRHLIHARLVELLRSIAR